MRRYEEQKRKTVIVQMAYLTDQTSAYRIGDSTIHMQVRSALLANTVDNATLKAAKNKDHTIESLRQKAMEDKQAEFLQLDQQIALQSKILTGLQLSYEVAFNRKTNTERLQLQNALLHRDLQGIEVLSVDSPKDDQR